MLTILLRYDLGTVRNSTGFVYYVDRVFSHAVTSHMWAMVIKYAGMTTWVFSVEKTPFLSGTESISNPSHKAFNHAASTFVGKFLELYGETTAK